MINRRSASIVHDRSRFHKCNDRLFYGMVDDLQNQIISKVALWRILETEKYYGLKYDRQGRT